jgi:protein-disulfide reductase (glutathione)
MVSSCTLPSRSTLLALALGGTFAQLGCVDPPQRGDGEAQNTGEVASNGPKRTATIPADGWNERIAWRGLDEGLREAQQTGMPVMMVVHTPWCGNCQKLKRSFADPKLERLSEQFVMVHVDQDQYPEATLYGPDGQYIPRVMFLDEHGNVDQWLQNPNRPNRHRFFYTPQEDLVAAMRQALDRHGNKS